MKSIRELLLEITAQNIPYSKLCRVRSLGYTDNGTTKTESDKYYHVEPIDSLDYIDKDYSSMSPDEKTKSKNNWIYNVPVTSEINEDIFSYSTPKLESKVMVSFTNDNDGYIVMQTDIDNYVFKSASAENSTELKINVDGTIVMNSDSFTYNEGTNGGLINIVELTSELNSLISELQAELVKIQTGITGVGGAYTPGTLNRFDKDDYEDEDFTH